ncbi:MAG: tyrosine-type recombinase/integrase [Oscillospiraceae bacterium]
MPRRGENIYKRRDGRWEGRILSDSGYHSVYAHSYSEVKQKLRIYSITDKPTKANRQTVAEYAVQWLATVKLKCKASTHNKYYNICKNHIIPFIGKYRLAELSASHIEDMLEQRETLSPKTKSDILCVVKMIISYAQQSGCPCQINLKSLAIRLPKGSMRVLSVPEQQRLTEWLLAEQTLRSAGVLLALSTGIRIGELCALRRKDISFESGLLHIGSTMQRIQTDDPVKRTKVVMSEPKSACSIRDIPLSEQHIAFFSQFYEDLPKEAFLLTGEVSHFTEPAALRYYFGKLTDACEFEGVHFHTLRHTFATRCVEAGVDIKTLSEILGHENVKITLDRYVHSSMDFKRQNMEKLCAYSPSLLPS